MKTPVNILLVESHPVTRLGLKTLFESQPDLRIVGEAASGAEAIELHRKLKPDVTLFELRMPDLCGVDAAEAISEVSPETKIVILAAQTGDAEISRALRNGAQAYVLSDASPEELLKAVRAVAAGGKYVSPDAAAAVSENLGAEDLTAAERRVLRMLVKGFSNQEIAAELKITENTVKTHIKNIFSKLGARDRTTAATEAIRRGFVRFDV